MKSPKANWPFPISYTRTGIRGNSELTQAELQFLRSHIKFSIREDEGFVSAINSDMNLEWEAAIPGTEEGTFAFENFSKLRMLKQKVKQDIKTKANIQRKIRMLLSE